MIMMIMMRMMMTKASISREVIDMLSNFTVFDIISIPQSGGGGGAISMQLSD